MKITITDVESDDKTTIVYFNSVNGNGKAIWASPEPPIANCQYHVEIDVEQTLDKMGAASNIDEQKYCLQLQGAYVVMCGTIEDIDEDGMAYFRLSYDCIIMIEFGSCSLKKGDWVKFVTSYSNVKITSN